MSQSLVSASWLKENMTADGKSIRVVDASFPMPGQKIDMKAEYEKSHIAGATFFSFGQVRDMESKFALTLPSEEQFAEHVGKVHGISDNTHVVVYDRNSKFGLFSATRLWWMFRVFGHSNVSVLDGGFDKWCAVGGATASGDLPSVEPGNFVSKLQPHLVRSFEDVDGALRSKSAQVCDARSAPRFNGEAPEPNPKLPSGHMVGAVNIPFFKMLDSETKTFKNPSGVLEVFAEVGIDISKPTIMSCGSGVTACALAFAAYTAGQEQVPVFDGSWTEFVQRASPEQKENLQFPFEQ